MKQDLIQVLKNIELSISSQGNPRQEDVFNVHQEFIKIFSEIPCYMDVYDHESNSPFDYDIFKSNISKIDNIKCLYVSSSFNLKERFNDTEYYQVGDVILKLGMTKAKSYYTTEELYKMNMNKEKMLITNSFILHKVNMNNEEIQHILDVFVKSRINTNIKRVFIEMVSYSNGSFYAEDYYLNDDFLKWEHPDEHYGEGFSDFHEKLMNKIYHNSKGLILFHGIPGSGKTQYIRKIIHDLCIEEKAKILYFSPAMIQSVTNPEFIDFITDWAKDDEENKKKRIIILEDAEPLLQNRGNNRENGITNLLNLTSGLLSDILSIQYICTFNTSVSDIDQALLREERLTAIKQFTGLSLEQSLNLAKIIGVDESLITEKLNKNKDKTLSLADIYSISNKSEILEHGIELKTKKIGFK